MRRVLLCNRQRLTINSVEDMKEDHFTVVAEMLVEHRGEFIKGVSTILGEDLIEAVLGVSDSVHFKFEHASEEEFEQASYDGERLIALCENVHTRD